MYFSHSLLFFSAVSLQAVAHDFDVHEGSFRAKYRSSQRRAEATTSGNSLTQQRSNDTLLIPLSIALNASPSTNLTIFQSPRAETSLFPSTSAPHRSLKPFDSFTHRVVCGARDFTVSSECNKRDRYNPSAWRRNCYPPRALPPGVPYQVEYGACAETEICMDARAGKEKRHYAVCIDLGVSVPLGGERGGENGNGKGGGGGDGELKREVLEESVHSTVEVGLGKDFGVKLLLMEDDGTTAVFAESLSIKALVREDTQQGELIQKPRALSEHCDHCTEVELPLVPANTAFLSAKVSLREGSKNVRMYVVSVEL